MPGIEEHIAAEVFRRVDERARSEKGEKAGHTRSMYYEYANMQDQNIGDDIRRWADANYLQNHPGALELGLSLSRKRVRSLQVWDVFEMLERLGAEAEEQNILEGLDTIVMNPTFLLNLRAESIAHFRESDEFKDLQDAIECGTNKAIISTMVSYLRFIAADAPEHYGPFRNKVRQYERRLAGIKIVAYLSQTAAIIVPIATGISALSLIGIIPIALELSRKRVKRIHDFVLKASRKKLVSTKPRRKIRELSEFCYEMENWDKQEP